jgi:TonB-dependent SusC/RagA subfamily outer membrane receptor
MMKKIVILLIILVLPVQISSAQGKNKKRIMLSGYVKDVNGSPVTDAIFFVDDVKVNTSPKRDGHYKFRIRKTASKITLLTYTLGTVEMPYEGQDTINFTFQIEQSPGQNQIPGNIGVVDIGYGKVTEKDLNASVSSIIPDEINITRYTNIFEMIKGELPGIIVNGTSIRIQGISSINGSNQPLFLVNGMNTGSIDFIHPRDVESLSIIKGPAASIYGSRGANGVISITLK